VVVPDVVPVDELAAIDAELDRLLPEYEDRAGHRPGWIMQVGAHSDVTRRVAEDPRLLSLIDTIVQPGIAIHSTKLVAKVPHSDIVCHWHQDEAFYTKPDDPATHSRTRMSIWLPLQNADERNGCLWVVPGSHRWGLNDFELVDYGQCRRKLTAEEYANEHAVPVRVPAGSAVLFSGYTWHHSKGNATDRVRRAFIVSYQEATLTRHGQEWRILRPAS
jgi:ectoine hydroxylase-related dioxygenase (phytanoyl-CoA dioxygenase family)